MAKHNYIVERDGYYFPKVDGPWTKSKKAAMRMSAQEAKEVAEALGGKAVKVSK